MRRYTALRPSAGTRIPDAVRRAVKERDKGCVGPQVGMPGNCDLGAQLDHVRASGAMGKKSESTEDNLVTLCNGHHLAKTEAGRVWRPKLLAYLSSRAA